MSAGSGTRILAGRQGTTRAELEGQATSAQSTTHNPAIWILIALLTLAGFLGVSPQLAKVSAIWRTDPLRSIGVCILATSLFLIVRVWRQQGWELRGTWWGLAPIALSFVPLMTSRGVAFFWGAHDLRINFIPSVFPIYLYVSGAVLLFGGFRLWRRAWFPLLLLICIQPVPEIFVRLLDLPMQEVAARVARSFAYALGLAPTDSELLRLMFTPSFGMFIAPGCDGMRGAVTLGYGALVLGYLKRMSLLKWGTLVACAVLMGHVFNLLRLCALVIYYKLAMGSPWLESRARLADYLIGGILFLVAVCLFLWLAMRSDSSGREQNLPSQDPTDDGKPIQISAVYWKAGAFAVLVLIIAIPGMRAATNAPESLALDIQRGAVTVDNLKDHIPMQVGAYKRVREWHEEIADTPSLEMAAFDSASNEIEIGVWLGSTNHSIRASLLTHGETPRISQTTTYVTAKGQSVPFNTALYDDGVTTTVIGDTHCSPSACYATVDGIQGIHLGVTDTIGFASRGGRFIPIFFKMQIPHTNGSDQATYQALLVDCKEFVSHFDFLQVSRAFQ